MGIIGCKFKTSSWHLMLLIRTHLDLLTHIQHIGCQPEKLLYMVNSARGLLNRGKRRKESLAAPSSPPTLLVIGENKRRTINSLVHKIRLHGRRGKKRLNPSREKNKGKHRRRKVEKSCVTLAGTSTNLTSSINGMTTHSQFNQGMLRRSRCARIFLKTQ